MSLEEKKMVIVTFLRFCYKNHWSMCYPHGIGGEYEPLPFENIEEAIAAYLDE